MSIGHQPWLHWTVAVKTSAKSWALTSKINVIAKRNATLKMQNTIVKYKSIEW